MKHRTDSQESAEDFYYGRKSILDKSQMKTFCSLYKKSPNPEDWRLLVQSMKQICPRILKGESELMKK